MITAGELRAYAKTITVSFSVLVRVHPATVHPATVHPTRITESHLQRFLDSLVSLGIVRNVGSECSESCKDLFCFWGFQAGKSPLPAMRPKTQTPEGRPFRGGNHRKAKGTHIRERIAIYVRQPRFEESSQEMHRIGIASRSQWNVTSDAQAALAFAPGSD